MTTDPNVVSTTVLAELKPRVRAAIDELTSLNAPAINQIAPQWTAQLNTMMRPH